MVIKRNSEAGLLATDAAGCIYLDLADGDGPRVEQACCCCLRNPATSPPFSPRPHFTAVGPPAVLCSELLPCWLPPDTPTPGTPHPQPRNRSQFLQHCQSVSDTFSIMTSPVRYFIGIDELNFVKNLIENMKTESRFMSIILVKVSLVSSQDSFLVSGVQIQQRNARYNVLGRQKRPDRGSINKNLHMALLQSPVFPLSGSIDSSDEVNIILEQTRNKHNVKILKLPCFILVGYNFV